MRGRTVASPDATLHEKSPVIGVRPRSWAAIARFVLFGLHGWAAVLLLPRTLARVGRSLLPAGADDVWAFGPIDARFRPWYNKIARDYRRRGRFGFAWDDGLGMSLGDRIYNNYATYWLLDRMGTRRFIGLGFVLMVLAVGVAAAWRFGAWAGVAVAILGAGSPLLVISYLHRGKPEVFWWGLGLIGATVAFVGPVPLAGLIWSTLAWVNIPIAVMLGLALGPAFVVRALMEGAAIGLIIGVLPGALKAGLRVVTMWRSGYMGTLVSEQARLWKRGWYPTARELTWMIPFVASVAASAATSGQPLLGGLTAFTIVALFWGNYRVLYVNDRQSFHLAFWTIGLGYAVAAGSIAGLVLILILAYTRPRFCGMPVADPPSPATDLWSRRADNAKRQLLDFPALRPIPFPRPEPLARFFAAIPDGSRFLAEADGDARTESRFRHLWVWSEDLLPQRDVDLVNEMYTAIVEPRLARDVLERFGPGWMASGEMAEVCRELGASHVVAHSRAMVQALEAAGFVRIAQVDLEPMRDFRELLAVPLVELVLLQAPEPWSIVEPGRTHRRQGSSLKWLARAGERYLVRYRFHPSFECWQAGTEVEVQPTPAGSGEWGTTFMSVRAPREGEIELRFRANRV